MFAPKKAFAVSSVAAQVGSDLPYYYRQATGASDFDQRVAKQKRVSFDLEESVELPMKPSKTAWRSR